MKITGFLTDPYIHIIEIEVTGVTNPQISKIGDTIRVGPNPFNPKIQISFELVADQEISLAVYDLRGSRIATIYQGLGKVGPQTFMWNGRDGQGRILPSGSFFLTLQVDNATYTRKISLVK